MSQNMIHLPRSHTQFASKFIRHVDQFIHSMSLFSTEKRILLSISGGVDSICLFHIFLKLNRPFEVVHFNHGTRPEYNLLEEELVRKLCGQARIKCHVFNFSFSLDENNFEEKARKKRREVYARFLRDHYWVYTAHHLDDSFEWTLMQTFKQSSLKTTLGIPVFNHGLVRPLLCVSKAQLIRFARSIKAEWFEDQSNNNTHYERNKMRHKVTKEIKKIYPSALKHYASRQNQLAFNLGVHRLSPLKLKIKKNHDSSGGVEIESPQFLPIKNLIKREVETLSTNTRGEIDHELSKICESHDQSNSMPGSFIKGPLNLSGGVHLFVLKNSCFIYSKNQAQYFLNFDEALKAYLGKTQIPDLVMILNYPYLLIDFTNKKRFSTKLVHCLLPKTCQWLKEQGISYTFAPLLSPRDRQMLVSSAVKLDSSLILP